MGKIGKRKTEKYIDEADAILFKEFDKSCGIYHLGEVTEEKLYVFRVLINTLRSYGVHRFFIEQSYCNSEYADILREDISNADITAVTHYYQQTEEGEKVLKRLYSGLCNRRINLEPESRRVSSASAQVVSYILENTDFGICSMDHDDSATRRIRKSANLIFDLNCDCIIGK